MDERAQQYFDDIRQAIASDQLVLPTLPEVALRIRDRLATEDCAFTDIAELLAQDAALSASFIRIANSPVYRGITEILDLQTAVNRMGLVAVRDLVMSLALRHIFMATSPILDRQFRSAWSTSVGVAAISRMLAIMAPGLSAEQALLAGLIHNIGVLPVLMMLEKQDHSFGSEEIQHVVEQLQGPVGQLILQSWEFPQHLQQVVAESYNFQRQHDGERDYVDLIQVSLIQGGFAKPKYEIRCIQAFEKLNLDPEVNIVEIEENQAAIEAVRNTLLH